MPSQTIELRAGGLTLAEVVAVAREDAEAELMEDARDAMAESAAIVERLAASPEPAYGVSTGFGSLATTPILPIAQVRTSFYLRLQVADQAGVLARITGILAERGISIDAVLQRESAEGEKQTDLIILTHDTREGEMNQAIAQMQALPTVLSPIVRIRKEELS